MADLTYDCGCHIVQHPPNQCPKHKGDVILVGAIAFTITEDMVEAACRSMTKAAFENWPDLASSTAWDDWSAEDKDSARLMAKAGLEAALGHKIEGPQP